MQGHDKPEVSSSTDDDEGNRTQKLNSDDEALPSDISAGASPPAAAEFPPRVEMGVAEVKSVETSIEFGASKPRYPQRCGLEFTS